MSCLHAYSPKEKGCCLLWNVHLLDRFWLICNHGAIQCNVHLFSVNSFIFVVIKNYFSNMTRTRWFSLKVKVCSNNLFVVSDRNSLKLTKQQKFSVKGREVRLWVLTEPKVRDTAGFF